MIIWFALLVPVVGVLLINVFWKHQVAWWESVLPIVVCAILIGVMKLSVETCQTADTEYWTGYVVEADYYEPWDEWVTETCYRTVTSTDSEGNTTEETESYDCSHSEYHGPEWWATDNNGISVAIDSQMFESFCKLFGQRQFVDMHRSYYTQDGDKYEAHWNQLFSTIVPMTHTHNYENRVQASHSLYNFRPIDPKKCNVFEYPPMSAGFFKGTNYFGIPSVLSKVNVPGQQAADTRLSAINALYGREKQIRVWMLIWGPGSTLNDAMDQEQYWKRGNKNELVLCIGLNEKNEPAWSYAFSWTEQEAVPIRAREAVESQRGQTINLVKVADDLRPLIEKEWIRKRFRDFSYLSVDPPTWSVFLTYILTALVTAGLCFFAVVNQYDEDGETSAVSSFGSRTFDYGWSFPRRRSPLDRLTGFFRRR